jgi:hypothetical protein
MRLTLSTSASVMRSSYEANFSSVRPPRTPPSCRAILTLIVREGKRDRGRNKRGGLCVCVSAGKMLAVVLKGWLAGVTSLSEKRQYAFHWGCAVKVKRKEGATAEGQ